MPRDASVSDSYTSCFFGLVEHRNTSCVVAAISERIRPHVIYSRDMMMLLFTLYIYAELEPFIHFDVLTCESFILYINR